MKKLNLWIKAFTLSVCLVTGICPLRVFAAEETVTSAPEEEKKDPNAPPESYNWEIQSDSWPSWPEGPKVVAETAILMDMDSGQILYAKGIDEKRYPASTTKIMTAWIALENSTLSEEINFTAEAVNSIEPGSTHIGIKPGEILTMEQSLYAILLASANEVSNGVAQHVGGSISEFVDMMNTKAASLGCENTHFVNPSGLHDDNHYTTARDLAVITSAAYKNKTFRDIIKTEYYIEPTTNITNEERWLNNHHKMLVQGERHYEGCTGGKTGYTTNAGNTLVTCASRNGINLVAVILTDTLLYQYTDTAALLDYGFNNFHKEKLSDSPSAAVVHTLPYEQYLLRIQNPEFLTCVEKGGCILLPNDIGTDSLTCSNKIEEQYIRTDYYLKDQYLMTKTVKVLPSASLHLSGYPLSDKVQNLNTDSEPVGDNNENQIPAENIKEPAQIPSQDSSVSQKSSVNSFQNLVFIFFSLPSWKQIAFVFMTGATLFYIILIIVKIRQHRKKRREKRHQD
ncbi:MAG: D-alanyl-D-alanine carboxypeptidase family protein [Blautia sp.]